MKFKKVEKPNQKLTNFFSRRDSNASSSRGLLSSQRTQNGAGSMNATRPLGQKKAANAPPIIDGQEVISVSSSSTRKSHISISSGLDSSVVLLSPPRLNPRSFLLVSPPRRSARVLPAPLSNITRKRSRSPSIQYMGMSQQAGPELASVPKPRTPTKRKKKFDNDSEQSPNDSVIMLRKSSGVPKPSSTSLPHQLFSRPSVALKSSSVINIASSSPCKSPSKQPHKRLRLADRDLGRDDQGIETIPSSQSDEQELAAPRVITKDPEDVKESVNRWRQEAASPSLSPVHGDWDMDIESDTGSEVLTPCPDGDAQCSSNGDPLNLTSNHSSLRSSPIQSSEAEVSAGLLSSGGHTSTTVLTTPATPILVVSSIRPTTPAPTISNAPFPPTPVALSEESKTAQIIAQIKANALAASAVTPDETSMLRVYKELEDNSSSDGEGGGGGGFDLFSQFRNMDKGEGEKVTPSMSNEDDPFTSRADSSIRSGRYTLRDHTHTPTPSLSYLGSPSTSHIRRTRTSTRSRVSASRQTKTKTKLAPMPQSNISKRKKSAVFDPLDDLLKEKILADKRGNGMDALRQAEESMDAVMEDGVGANETDKDEDSQLMDEAAARRAIELVRSPPPKSSSPAGGEGNSGEESVVLGEDEAKLLGFKNGKQMKKILDSDRAKKGKMKEEKFLGQKLWDDNPRPKDSPLKVARLEFPLALVDQNPIFRLLQNAWYDWSDHCGIAMLVDSGVLASLELSKYVPLVPFLCDAAFSGHDVLTGDQAFRILSYLWDRPFPEIRDFIPLISHALIRLGACPVILESLGWPLSTASNQFVKGEDRATAIYRLVSLIQSASQSGALTSQDIPDAIMALLIIAIDPSSSVDLKRDIMIVVDTICQSFKGDSGAISATELALCNKALKFSAELTPINKAHFISFLSSGCDRTIRIARRLAHGLLVHPNLLSAETSSKLPPLSNLIQLLSPAHGSAGLFDIQTNADMVDYEDLGYQVEILNVALSCIDDYVAEERRIEREESMLDSPRKLSKQKLPTPLDMVRTAIDVIHGKIVDTRAAHLDRSRTKAALQRLSMRIYYQRLAASKSGLRGGTRKIHDFFAPST